MAPSGPAIGCRAPLAPPHGGNGAWHPAGGLRRSPGGMVPVVLRDSGRVEGVWYRPWAFPEVNTPTQPASCG